MHNSVSVNGFFITWPELSESLDNDVLAAVSQCDLFLSTYHVLSVSRQGIELNELFSHYDWFLST